MPAGLRMPARGYYYKGRTHRPFMAKQCPRCWEKIEPGTEVCPHCGFELVRKEKPNTSTEEKKSDGVQGEQAPAKRRVVFPTAKKKDDAGFTYKLVFALTLVWAVIAIIGGVYNLAVSVWLQGAGLIASGVLSLVAFNFIRIREHYFVASVAVLVSGAATLQIILLIFSFFISFLVYSNAKLFKSK